MKFSLLPIPSLSSNPREIPAFLHAHNLRLWWSPNWISTEDMLDHIHDSGARRYFGRSPRYRGDRNNPGTETSVLRVLCDRANNARHLHSQLITLCDHQYKWNGSIQIQRVRETTN